MKKIYSLIAALVITLSSSAQTVSSDIGGSVVDLTPDGVKIMNNAYGAGGVGKVLMPVGDKLLFVGEDEIYGQELWITDGTKEGTQILKDINPGELSSYPNLFTKSGDVVYFTATTFSSGNELWVTDGTEEGTRLVLDVFSGQNSAEPDLLTPFVDGKLLFRSKDFFSGEEKHLWCTDGTGDGTYRVAMVQPLMEGTAEGHPRYNYIQVANDKAFFFASSPEFGKELWVTDGEEMVLKSDDSGEESWVWPGTNMILDIDFRLNADGDATLDNAPTWLMAINDKQVVFNAITPVQWFDGESTYETYGSNPWITDGTPEGTYPTGDMNTAQKDESNTKGSGAAYYCLYNGKVYCRGNHVNTGNQLYEFTNEPFGTSLEHPFIIRGRNNKGKYGNCTANNLTVFDDELFFVGTSDRADGDYLLADGDYPGREVMAYNSITKAKTVLDINPGRGKSSPKELVVSNNRLYFQANVNDVESIYMVKPKSQNEGSYEFNLLFNAGIAADNFLGLTDANGYLYFMGRDQNVGGITRLYVYDDELVKEENNKAAEYGPEPNDAFQNTKVSYYCSTENESCSNLVCIDTCEDSNVSVGDVVGAKDITLYPNPVKGMLNVAFDYASDINMSIYNVSGRLVWSGLVKNGEPINVAHLQDGIYIAQVYSLNGDVIYSQKLHVKK